MSNLRNAADGFLEGFSGGGLFSRSRRLDAPTRVFAEKTSSPRAVALMEELDAVMAEHTNKEYSLLRAKVSEEDVAAFRHTLQRLKAAVTSASVK